MKGAIFLIGFIKENHRGVRLCCWLLLAALLLSGCASTEDQNPTATVTPGGTDALAKGETLIPEKLERGAEGAPLLNVYQTDEKTVAQMDIETYLEGVLAGEMKNDWPMEALKAQAILARTFVLKFCTEKESKYQGADISTDIKEAQAYDATGVNDRIVEAVSGTRGRVLVYEGSELPYAWFHAHSGGQTTRAKTGLDYEQEEPGYTGSVEGLDSDKAPADAKSWKLTVSAEELLTAAKSAGLKDVASLQSVEMGEKDESGRVKDIVINGQSVSAPSLRIALGSTKMRSTLLDTLELNGGKVAMAGRGYGHGVGMPQWGAYAMAEQGKTAEDIVTYYFKGVTVEKLW